MKNFLFILIVIVFTVLLLLFITNPGLLDKIWLWIVGLIGGIIGLFRNIVDQLKGVSGDDESAKNESSKTLVEAAKIQQQTTAKVDELVKKIEDKDKNKVEALNKPFNGTTITVLRYLDDSETTLGILYVNKKFFTYSLEDTFRPEKIAGETRIPSGTYSLDFNNELTDLTKKYQSKFDWFKFHLEIKDVPNYKNVYIHIGNTKKDTAGCLLIADGVTATSAQKSISYSTQAYKRFYEHISKLIENGEKVRIAIHDENWFQKINVSNN